MTSTCESCPWSGSEPSIDGINWGCLPCPSDMLKYNEEKGRAQSCHDNPKIVCRGLTAFAKKNNISLGAIITYKEWYG